MYELNTKTNSEKKVRNCEINNLDTIIAELYKRLAIPLYIPTLMLGAQSMSVGTNNPIELLALIAAISFMCIALLPFACAIALRANLK